MINRNSVTGILVGLGVIVVIFSAIPWGIILALGFWIYFGVMVWKRKTVFGDIMDPELAEKRMKKMKIFMIAAAISFPVAIAGIIMHNVSSSLSGTEEALYFLIGIISLYLFIIASGGGLVLFIRGRQKPI